MPEYLTVRPLILKERLPEVSSILVTVRGIILPTPRFRRPVASLLGD
jgi:hypothetical protein